uniref:Uncharacterized protein n=1 Tax=Rhizophora mucronata TaxID=61149 RepID=A0A2P2Q0R1_RHIMU
MILLSNPLNSTSVSSNLQELATPTWVFFFFLSLYTSSSQPNIRTRKK